jgi:uncharacterized protein YjdB
MQINRNLAMMATMAAGLAVSGCSEDGAQPPAVAAVDVVAPALPLAVYGTLQLSATVRDGAGNPLTDRAITWSSGTPALASVSATGTVTALAAGSAIISATADGRTGSVTISILPAPVNSVTLLPGTLALVQGGTAVVTAELRDERGAILSDRAITWSSGSSTIAAVTGAGGNTPSATVQGLNGGTAAITALVEGQTATASVTVTDTVASVQVTPATVSLQPGQTVELSAAVRNGSGATLIGRTVSWQSSAPSVVSVSSAGVASALVDGTATITAMSEGKSGSAVITVAAPKGPPGEPPPAAGPTITGVTPSVLVAGAPATITGTGLATSGNTVTIGGVSARVLSESAAQLQVTVPCIPSSSAVAVRVTANAVTSAAVQQALQVASRHTLSVGQSTIIDSNAAIACSEIPASSSQSRYVVAVYNTLPSPGATADYTVSGYAAGTGTGQVLSNWSSAFTLAPSVPVRTTSVAPAIAGSAVAPVMAHDAHHELMEKNRRAYEALHREYGAAIVAESLRPQAQAATVEPPVNATIRVSNINSNSICSNFHTIQATRVYYAGKLAIYEDDATPTALKAANNALMASYYKRIGDSYNETMEPVVREYFGDPLRRDALTDNDGVLRAVFTPVINNNFPNVAGFVVSCDLYPTTTSNSQSNHGEYFYAQMPVNTNSGYAVGTPEYWFWTIRTTFIHEAKHVASFVARLANNASSWESGWLEEGTARHAEELWARNAVYNAAFRGNTGYGSAANPTSVYCDVRPSWDSCNGTNPNRPSNHMQRHFGGLYSFLGNSGLLSPFGPSASDGGGTYYAVAWSFIRYVADRYAQDERAFFTALNQSSNSGVANLSARAGVTVNELLGRWALALYADDMPGLGNRPELQFATWDLPNVYAGLRTDFPGTYQRATPLVVNYLPFGNIAPMTPGGLVGGGVHYYEISGSNAAGQTFQLLSSSGGAPSSVLNMAVLRVQ